MKIGILTFHRALNYGAVLQCYALQMYLKMLGHEVRVIDYRQAFIEKTYKPFSVVKLLNIVVRLHFGEAVNYLRRYPARKSKQQKFRQFSERYLDLTSPCTEAQIPDDFDLYVHGSDQIWNEKLTGGLDKIYLGEYPVKAQAKKITYAASMKVQLPDEQAKAIFTASLGNFQALSVREQELISLLQPFYSQGTIVPVVDPTLLAPRSLWEPFIRLREGVPTERYVALYRVGLQPLAPRQAEEVARGINAKIVEINTLAPDPAQFVSLIYHAECVVSDSFHATVFALLFGKDFYTAASDPGRDVRLTNLLGNFGLESRLLYACTTYTPVIYADEATPIERLRHASETYLKSLLLDE